MRAVLTVILALLAAASSAASLEMRHDPFPAR